MRSQGIIDRIKSLDRDEYDALFLAEMDGWIARVKEAEALRKVSENFVLKEFISRYAAKIEEIDGVLKTKRKIPELDRENMLDRKELYLDFINSFDVERRIEAIEKEVAAQLDEL